MALPGTETIRFRRPTSGPGAVAQKEVKKDEFGSMAPQGWKRRHQGLLQDQVGRQTATPFIPSLSLAVRLLMLVRTAGAMYSLIADCDEVFNFFEPLHYFQHNSGFQTWELSPEFAIRSWSYILLHWPLAHLGPALLKLDKRQQFFFLRISLGLISSFCEAKFYRTVVEAVNERVGRYLLFAMMLSAGMWTASVAFLPSSFAMYTTLLASSYSFHPATSTSTGTSRAYKATFLFALGAIVGWPFSALLGLPFVFEQLFLTGGEVAVGGERSALSAKRWTTMTKAVALGATIAIPTYLVDSWAYGRSTFPTFNILSYNLLSPLSSPDLYGTSPWSFYLRNLFLNFNFLVPLALVSLPLLGLTYRFDYRRLGKSQQKPKPGETSPFTLLIIRLIPFYLWLGVLTAQQHKEERFFYPAYPLLCFNAAVSVYLIKGLFEQSYIQYTASPYKASQSSMFSNFSLFTILFPSVLSISRIFGLVILYRAPLEIAHRFQYHTIPAILADHGFSPKPPPKNYVPYTPGEKLAPEWDLSPLKTLDPPITLCYGKEWYRFPGSYLIPEGVQVRLVQSDFDGMMPRQWEKSAVSPSANASRGAWLREETRVVRPGKFNGLNQASLVPGTYTPVEECTYLVDVSLPSQPPTALQPDYISDPAFEREHCTTFLDAQSSTWWSRIGYLPQGVFENGRVWGEYCLLKRK